ncbi:hypothetical protein AB1Y20_022635 [Prymnesium parvum]|uniref:CST complex subunit CTC1 n=1 Tax=Prymnesium parvum TaxID=97485 RepID=A0AB34JI60_PRYPA
MASNESAGYPYWAIIQGLTEATELNGRLARVLGPPTAEGRHELAVGHPYAAGITPEAAFIRKRIRPQNLFRPRERRPLASIAATSTRGEPCIGLAHVVLYDAMCPRQRLRLRLSDEHEHALAKLLFFDAPEGTIGMVGVIRGRGVPCSHGVELHLEHPLSVERPPPSFEPSRPLDERHDDTRLAAHELAARHPPSPLVQPQLGAGRVALAGGHVFELLELLEPLPSRPGVWFRARVLWRPRLAPLSACAAGGEDEAEPSDQDDGGLVGCMEKLASSTQLDAAHQLPSTRRYEDPNLEGAQEQQAMSEQLRELVPEWLQLVQSKGRSVDITLSDIGSMPEAWMTDALAFWVTPSSNTRAWPRSIRLVYPCSIFKEES